MKYELKRNNLEFLSVSHLGMANNFHLHNEVEIIMNMGQGALANIFVNGKKYQLKPNECIYIAPGQIHSSETLSNGLFWVYIFPADVTPSLKKVLLSQVPDNPVFNLCGTQLSIDVRDILRHHWKNADKTNSDYSKAIFISAINLIMANLIYILDFKEISGDNQLVKNVIFYISENYTEQTSVTEIAKRFLVPEYLLTKLFNSSTGLTIPSFRNWIRVSNAAEMLKSTNDAITVISGSVGFNSIRNFNLTFAKFYGMTPSEYRESHKLSHKNTAV